MNPPCSCPFHRAGHWCRWLVLAVLVIACAAIERCWPAWRRAPIVVQCGDAAGRRATATVLRRALGDARRALGRLPSVRLHVRVLAVAGSPPDFADLGRSLAVWRLRETATGPLAIITLAATVEGRRVEADQLVVALAAALDAMDDWRPGQATTWTLPAGHPAVLSQARPMPSGPMRPPLPIGPTSPPPSPSPSPLPPRDTVAERAPDDPLGLSGD